jgi:3-oxoacyl-[acyl-carrier-protein] synthase-3
MFAKIAKLDYYLPDRLLGNDELAQKFPDWPAPKIKEKTGVEQRHLAAPGETALDLGYRAAEQVLQQYDRNQVDFLLFCTQSPDYFLPTSACVLQDKLRLSTKTGALDFNLGCSGYIYGLVLAEGLVAAGVAKTVLLITAETYSKYLHPQDQSNLTLFGDGASATLLEASPSKAFLDFTLGTDGSGFQNLIVKRGGARARVFPGPESSPADSTSGDFLFMNGPEIFNFTIRAVPALITEVLQKNRLTLEEIDCVIFHQANKFMLEHLRRKIGIPAEKFFLDMAQEGNTVSSTIPIALAKCLAQGKIRPGNTVLLVGFGVGYSWGAALVRF